MAFRNSILPAVHRNSGKSLVPDMSPRGYTWQVCLALLTLCLHYPRAGEGGGKT